MAKVLLLNCQQTEQDKILVNFVSLFLYFGWNKAFTNLIISAEMNVVRKKKITKKRNERKKRT
jgi:hypothetical protein